MVGILMGELTRNQRLEHSLSDARFAKDLTPEERRDFVEKHDWGYSDDCADILAPFGEHIVSLNFYRKIAWTDFHYK